MLGIVKEINSEECQCKKEKRSAKNVFVLREN
jgi:hypothetical protein